jgi:hypothetical protein
MRLPFYAHPTLQISPGDIFPSIPFSVSVPPLKIARNEGYTPPRGRGPAEFRRIYTLPNDAAQIQNLRIETPRREETLSNTRTGKALFLTWGSEVEDTERRIAEIGRAGNRSWLAAPVYNLQEIPAENTEIDPDTNERVPVHDLIRLGKTSDTFYLPPFPAGPANEEHYADFRKITSIGVEFFLQARANRLVTLMPESLNEMYSYLLRSLTRAELFFRPIQCECGRQVPIDIRIHGQNFDAEPWE